MASNVWDSVSVGLVANMTAGIVRGRALRPAGAGRRVGMLSSLIRRLHQRPELSRSNAVTSLKRWHSGDYSGSRGILRRNPTAAL